MKYYAITVNTTTIGSELVSDIFFDLGGQGVSVIDSADVIELYKDNIVWDYIEENLLINNPIVKVTGYTSEDSYFSTLSQLKARLEELKNNTEFSLGSFEITIEEVDKDDWHNTWKKFYSPIELDKIAIVPSWHNYTKDKVIVRINPGMAFGTGEHESTKMCLELMQGLELEAKDALDIGCGSGILGIAAIKLGAKSCYFADIDSVALDNMRENATLNNTLDKSVIEQASLTQGQLIMRGDILLANITADILIKLSEDIKDVLNTSATIILSGIIKEREEEVVSAYIKAGLCLEKRLTQNDWVALQLSYGA